MLADLCQGHDSFLSLGGSRMMDILLIAVAFYIAVICIVLLMEV
jgi:hypothetical protein